MSAALGRAEKVCPLVFRHRAGVREVLAFRHPHAGLQLVKGSPKAGEPLAEAAARELFEESGLRVIRPPRALGQLSLDAEGGRVWALFAVAVPRCPARWSWKTRDDHGHVFRFFWQPLRSSLGPAWHGDFRRVMAALRSSGLRL